MLPTSTVHLLSGVPLSNNYKNQMSFETKEEQYEYFYSKRARNYNNVNYIREGNTLKVEAPYDDLLHCNYMMYQNYEYGDKWFYAFITKKEYINPNVTLIHMEIDVFQTWLKDFTMQKCFVEREHTRQYDENGFPDIHTIDEGLDYGSEMDTVYFREFHPHEGLFWLVMVSKTAMHMTDNSAFATVIGTPQPLSYYLLPFKLDGTTVSVSTPEGEEVPELQNIQDVLNAMYANEEAVNNIVSLYVTDNIGLSFTYADNTVIFNSSTDQILANVSIKDSDNTFWMTYVAKVNQFTTKTMTLNEDKYLGCTEYEESKLMMYPYTQAILTDFRGNQFNFKLECINGSSIQVDLRGSIGLSNKTSINIKEYNLNGTTYSAKDDFENGFINSDSQDLPVITEHLASYLQGNRNSLTVARQQAQFNMVMGLATTGASIVTSGGMAAVPSMVSSMSAMAGVQGVQSIGNSYFDAASRLAKRQDIANTPPNLSQQGSNTAFSFGNGFTGFYLIKKQIKPEYAQKLSGYFKMYGYQVNELKIPNYKTRESFNYIKTANCIIKGNMPHDHLSLLMKIFDAGVTIWHGDWVGDYDRTNNVL